MVLYGTREVSLFGPAPEVRRPRLSPRGIHHGHDPPADKPGVDFSDVGNRFKIHTLPRIPLPDTGDHVRTWPSTQEYPFETSPVDVLPHLEEIQRSICSFMDAEG